MKHFLNIIKFTLFVALLAFGVNMQAQIAIPAPSPAASVTQKVGLVDVKVEYSRPSAKGRKIFGDVVSYDKIWRTGANSPTSITFGDTVTIGSKKIPAGSYALYTIPNVTTWTIILSKNAYMSASDYKDGDEIVKFMAVPTTLTSQVETFTIDFANLTRVSADILLTWENTSIKFPISTDSDAKILAEIKKKIDNTDTYWNAASYYYDNDKDLNMALDWTNKVIEKNPQFWTLHLKAKILAKQKNCAGAVEAANKSIALAKIAQNDEYIKMNQKLIDACPISPSAPKKKK